MKLTHELIHEMCKCGCPNKDQLALLGLVPPLHRGWLDRLVGREVSEETWTRVLAFRGLSPGRRKKLIRREKQPELL